jgi:hypothetical protein
MYWLIKYVYTKTTLLYPVQCYYPPYLNSDGQQFYQYQQNKQSHLTLTDKKKDHDITTFKSKLELFYTSEKIWSLTFFAEYIIESGVKHHSDNHQDRTWISNYLCNQYRSPPKWVRIPLVWRCTRYNLSVTYTAFRGSGKV